MLKRWAKSDILVTRIFIVSLIFPSPLEEPFIWPVPANGLWAEMSHDTYEPNQLQVRVIPPFFAFSLVEILCWNDRFQRRKQVRLYIRIFMQEKETIAYISGFVNYYIVANLFWLLTQTPGGEGSWDHDMLWKTREERFKNKMGKCWHWQFCGENKWRWRPNGHCVF